MNLTGEKEKAFVPGPILLMGAPGVGKGTQAKALVARFGVPQVSTGDLLRANMAAASEEGRQARKLMGAGTLVPDELVNQMVEHRLAEPDTQRGYVLDGYPRTLAQAEWLDAKLESSGAPAKSMPLVAVSIQVGYDQLLRRITGRRICPVCGRIYNIYLHPPVESGKCDVDGSPLERRDDDSEDVFAGRMRAYQEQTSPVVEHYRALGRLEDVDGTGSLDEVSARLENALHTLRSEWEG